jgi:hypothetical protein
MYSPKVVAFFDKLLDQQFSNKPFMRHYLDYYWDIYWDLRFRETIPPNFDHDYVAKAVIPFFLTSFYEDQRPMLPMIGVNFSKENAANGRVEVRGLDC